MFSKDFFNFNCLPSSQWVEFRRGRQLFCFPCGKVYNYFIMFIIIIGDNSCIKAPLEASFSHKAGSEPPARPVREAPHADVEPVIAAPQPHHAPPPAPRVQELGGARGGVRGGGGGGVAADDEIDVLVGELAALVVGLEPVGHEVAVAQRGQGEGSQPCSDTCPCHTHLGQGGCCCSCCSCSSCHSCSC